MRRVFLAVMVVGVLIATRLTLGKSQDDDPGIDHVPNSTVEQAGDNGRRAHTNHVIHERSAAVSGPSGFSPSQLEAAYELPATGGSGVIAIIDAYDYRTALSDFNTFATEYGLPKETAKSATTNNPVFQVVYANGREPSVDCGWNQEAALDIEWAHAMAPSAKIVLVEAGSSSFTDLFTGVGIANGMTGVGQVSMSWGGSEFKSENSYDSNFSNSKISYFAAAGDSVGVPTYPSVSPNVVSAGGTSLKIVGSTVTETAWGSTGRSSVGGGGGPSEYELLPTWQHDIVTGTHRGTPDVSFDADPATGVSVYDSTSCEGLVGWLVFGGTSVATPSLAGIVNKAHEVMGTSEQKYLYGGYPESYGVDFRDITSSGAEFTRYPVVAGWDFTTGIGSVLGLLGK